MKIYLKSKSVTRKGHKVFTQRTRMNQRKRVRNRAAGEFGPESLKRKQEYASFHLNINYSSV
jgi:hypothetical protein